MVKGLFEAIHTSKRFDYAIHTSKRFDDAIQCIHTSKRFDDADKLLGKLSPPFG